MREQKHKRGSNMESKEDVKKILDGNILFQGLTVSQKDQLISLMTQKQADRSPETHRMTILRNADIESKKAVAKKLAGIQA